MNFFGVYLSLAMLLIVLLAMNISRLRIKHKVANGDGGNKVLTCAIRAHMNAIEHLVPFSILMYFAYAHALNPTLVKALCFGFLLVRFLHSYSMLASKFRVRQVTAGLTYALEFIACVLVFLISL